MKNALFIAFLILLQGCIKEKVTNTRGFVRNPTSRSIKIIGFSGGRILNDTLTVVPDGKLQIGKGFMRGIANDGGFISDFNNADSVQVIFDNTYKVSHYLYPPNVPSRKHHLYSSKRNFLNKDSYRYEFTDVSKYQRDAVYTYEFTEQDYLDAK